MITERTLPPQASPAQLRVSPGFLLVLASRRERASRPLDDNPGGPVARVHTLFDVLVLHELRQEAPYESVASPCICVRFFRQAAVLGPSEARQEAGWACVVTNMQRPRGCTLASREEGATAVHWQSPHRQFFPTRDIPNVRFAIFIVFALSRLNWPKNTRTAPPVHRSTHAARVGGVI